MSRRWLLVGAAAFLGLLLLAITSLFLFYGKIGAWVVRSKVLPRLAERFDREVEVGEVEVSRGRVVLSDLVVRGPGDEESEPLAVVPRVVIDYDFWASLSGDVAVHRVVVEDPRLKVVRNADGTDNFRDLLESTSGRGAPEGGGRRSGLRPQVARLEGGRVELNDRKTGVTVVAEGVSASLEDGAAEVDFGDVAAFTVFGPHAEISGATLSFDLGDPVASAAFAVKGGRADLWKGMSLTGIAGTLARGEEAGQLHVDFSGGYGGAEGTLWEARGWLDPRKRTGNVRLAADRFTFDRISSVLKDSPFILDYDQTSIDVSIELEIAPERIDVDGSLALEGLNLHHPMVSAEPIRDFSLEGSLQAYYDREARVAGVSEARLSSGGVDYDLEGVVMLPGGLSDTGEPRAEPRVEARITVPPVPCQTVLDSIPPAIAPKLQGFRLKGTFETDVEVAIDWADLEATVLDGSVGIFGCRVLDAPGELSADRLQGSFEVEVPVPVRGEEEDEWIKIIVGEASENYVPLWDISPHVINSFMTTEDSSFYSHHGFIPREFRTALIRDLEAGYFKYGASSITMQMVKNVLLHREKTLSRKFQELFLTWHLERKLEKDRIMEIYVNAIEYGPALYGLKPAAEVYFGKHPRYLNPVEAAFFSSLLPGPRRRYKQFCRGELGRWTEGKIKRILWHMHDRDRLSEEEYLQALETPLVFNPEKSELCRRRAQRRSRRN